MRKLALLLCLLPLLAFAAGGIALDTSVRTEFTDCASIGSTAQSLVRGNQYLFRVTDADTFICFAESSSTCASGGEKFPAGTVMLITIQGAQVSASCRSSGTGDAIFTRVQ